MYVISFLFYTFFPLIVGLISSALSNTELYSNVIRPFLSPPAIVFPIVWTILYLLLGYSSYITKDDKKSLKLFYINLAINFIWSLVFFNGGYLQGFILIIIMLVIEALLLIRYYSTNKKAFIINIIYSIWLLFAAYLSLGVYLLN